MFGRLTIEGRQWSYNAVCRWKTSKVMKCVKPLLRITCIQVLDLSGHYHLWLIRHWSDNYQSVINHPIVVLLAPSSPKLHYFSHWGLFFSILTCLSQFFSLKNRFVRKLTFNAKEWYNTSEGNEILNQIVARNVLHFYTFWGFIFKCMILFPWIEKY